MITTIQYCLIIMPPYFRCMPAPKKSNTEQRERERKLYKAPAIIPCVCDCLLLLALQNLCHLAFNSCDQIGACWEENVLQHCIAHLPAYLVQFNFNSISFVQLFYQQILSAALLKSGSRPLISKRQEKKKKKKLTKLTEMALKKP